MFDEKEIEELCGEFLSLDSKMFVESDDNIKNFEGDFIPVGINVNFLRTFPNLKNNNFIDGTLSFNPDKPGTSTELDLLNENFISLDISESDNSAEDMNVPDLKVIGGKPDDAVLIFDKKKNEIDIELKDIDEKLTSPDIISGKDSFSQNGWTHDTLGLWHSGPSSLNLGQASNNYGAQQDLALSVTSYSRESQSLNSFSSSSKRIYGHQQLGAKVEMVYSLLSMLDTDNREDMSKTFLAMSSSPESCHAMRQSGCLPLLIQLIHSSELNKEVRKRAAETLHNIVHSQTDEKRRRREIRVLKLLQQVREYCDVLKNDCVQDISQLQNEAEKHPINAIGTLMKFSFDAEHRQAICVLGGLHAVTQLLQVDHEAHGSTSDNTTCITLRRYAGMSLTNLTFGDGKNKALLCSFNKFMRALVEQLKSPNEDLRQVTASVLRNLSWRADSESKQALRDVGAVIALTVSAMEVKKESTLKSVLSALWNLSAHCSLNKMDICSVPGALNFLVKMLKYKSSSNTLSIVENAGGILRNISSHIAVREDYRQILRDSNCFEVLLEQLKSPSLTVVSNACGTLWNLSARCPEDQKRLWEMGATTMLRSLVQSKHKMISMGSSAALKNLLAANPDENLLTRLDSTAKNLGLQNLPTLFVRKKRALEQELNITLAETCDNIDHTGSPTHFYPSQEKIIPKRSESRDSVHSTQSDSVYERISHVALKNEEKVLENQNVTLHNSLDEKSMPRKAEDQKFMRRFKCSMIPTPTFKKINQDRINEKTKEETALEDRVKESVLSANSLKLKSNSDSEQEDKKGIPVLDSRTRSKANQRYEVSDENFFLHSNEDCFEANEKCHRVIANSHEVFIDSEKNALKESNSDVQVDDVIETGKYEIRKKNERDQENCTNSKDEVFLPATAFRDEKIWSFERNSFEKISANCKSKTTFGLPESGDDEIKFESGLNEGEILWKDSSISFRDSNEIVQPSSEDKHLKINELNEDKKINTEISPPDKSKETELKNERFASKENFSSPTETFTPDKRFTGKKSSHVSVGTSLNLSQQGYSPGESVLENGDHPKIKRTVQGIFDSKQADTGELESISQKFDGVSQNLACDSNNQFTVNADFKDDDVRTPSSGDIFPKFKVGSPITDSKALQIEANKICREIKKQQDFEMGCSLTSEVSLVSCSSFLDTGDYSLFDSSTEAVDFDDSENVLPSKTLFKMKVSSFRKPGAFQKVESVSLPSLGSLKNEQLDTLDLDNSVLSVASITSEIAETYSKDAETLNHFSKSCEKINAENEFMEETDADATLVSNGDETLNVDSLQNNAEFFDDDNSLYSEENLPLDPENLTSEKTSYIINKKLTPKEKRKTFQERYRTYIIRDHQGSKLPGKDYVADLQDQTVKEPVGCIQQNNQQNCTFGGSEECNQNQRDGFEQEKSNEESRKFNLPLTTFHRGSECEKFYFSKSFDGEPDKIPDPVFDSKSLNDLLSIGPAERKELVDNAKLVAFSLKTAIHESEIVSDSEAEDNSKSVEIDTATYSKNHRDRFFGKFSSQGLQSLQQYEDVFVEENPEKKGAKILKPSDQTNEKLELSRGIRGRRKPLYTSPRKNSCRTITSLLNSPKMSKVEIATGKPLTDVCKSPVLHREGTFTKTDLHDLKKTETKNLRTIPVLQKTSDSKGLNSSRPFGKNKPASCMENSRRSGENHVSKIRRPLSAHASKNIERRAESDSSQRRPFSAGTGNRITGDKTGFFTRPVSSGLSSPKMKNSSSNQNIKTGSNSGSGFPVKSRNLTAQSSKSQSDASLNFVGSKDRGDTTNKERTPKKEVTSKIASLWRRVEETKQKNQNLKDDRVWICAKKKSDTSDEVLIVEKEEILDIPTQKIVHSFTCQTLADERPTHFRFKETDLRSSREFLHVRDSEEREEKTKKSRIILAAMPAFNYYIPISAQGLPYRIKKIDAFINGSLKIPTV